MVYKSHRGFMVGTLALRLLSAVAPVAMLWIGKLIIEAVELYYRGGQPVDWSYLWTLVVIELVIATGAEIISRASNLMEGLLGEHFRNEVSVRLMVHSATLDVAQFEDAALAQIAPGRLLRRIALRHGGSGGGDKRAAEKQGGKDSFHDKRSIAPRALNRF